MSTISARVRYRVRSECFEGVYFKVQEKGRKLCDVVGGALSPDAHLVWVRF